MEKAKLKEQAGAELCQAQLSYKLKLKLQSKLAVEAEVIPYFQLSCV